MAGIRKSQLRRGGKLADFTAAGEEDYPFAVDPLPNLYFTRDPFACIGGGVSLHRMHTVTRNRETLFGKFIFEHHPKYKDVPRWYDRGETSSLEGGDILVLSPEVLAVGISERTREDSIDALAETVLREGENPFGTMRLLVSRTPAAGALALRCGREQVLTARCWRRDDRLMLPGSRGERSVKRLLSERGIPPEKRETLPVFCVDGVLAAVWGVGTDMEFLPEQSGQNKENTVTPNGGTHKG